ncbi:hypothetical protein Tco_0914379 [Tanacetum coccineum]
MATPIISISSDSSKESMGSHTPRMILFGVIPTIIPVIPEVPIVLADPIVTPEDRTVSVVLPTRVLDLVDYSYSSDSDPSEDSLPPVPDLPLVSPSGLSSHDTLAPILEILTVRKSVRLLSSHRLALSEAFRRWRFATLSTPYPSTTSESSLGLSSERSLDSSSLSSRLSRKRCRSLTSSEPSPTHVSRSIAPTLVDLLPPRKRFRDSYSSEDNGEEHIEVDTADSDVGISKGVVAYPKDSIDMGVEIAISDVREDDEEFEAEAIHYMSEVRIDRITEIETTQKQLETSQLVASGKRASLVDWIGSLRLEYLKIRAMLSIKRDWIDSLRWHMALS